jgi:hypothetical protein
LIGEWEAKWEEQTVGNGRDVHGVLSFRVFRTPASQSVGVLGRLHPVVTGVRQHHFLDLERPSFWSERFGFVHGRS